jgi:hypothetical protein
MRCVLLSGIALLAVCGAARADDDVLQRAQDYLAHHDNRDMVNDAIKAQMCLPGENDIVCNTVVLCNQAPEIAGEKEVDDTEMAAATKALIDAGPDLKKQALAADRLNVVSKVWRDGVVARIMRCGAKVRSAFQHAATSQQP